VSRVRVRSLIVLLVIIVSVYSCIETFFPPLPNKTGYLVIEALITDEARSYDVYLTRSITALNSKVTYVKGATVSISESDGKEYFLQEISSGHYITDSKKFLGKVGGKYVLHIKAGSDVYESDTCSMCGSSAIDRLYLGKSSKFFDNGASEVMGLSIYLDGSVSDISNYVRWDFSETWKYSTAYPPYYSFTPPSTFNPITPTSLTCWKSARSTDILISSFQDQKSGLIRNKEVAFFLTNASDRFNQRYSILVNQYIISRAEYDFWNAMKASNQESGGIFEKQPYTTSGNIRNLRSPSEVVLGYFQVASIRSMRLYVDPYDLFRFRLFPMNNPCNTTTYTLGYQGDTGPLRSINSIYDYIIGHDSVIVRPYWNDNGALVGIVGTSKACADCAVTSDPNKPAFWTDGK
jgi:hypothetical protein